MVYMLEPVNRPYDPEEPMPTPLGFIVAPGGFKGSDLAIKREFKPVSSEELPKRVEVGGNRLMPDFFSLAANHYYVSSRFRAVLEKYASGAVEHIKVAFNIPANKHPVDAYYFINVLGRSQLMDWESTHKQGPRSGRGTQRFYVLSGTPDQWTMRAPPPDHPAIWHEVHRNTDDLIYLGSGTRVFVTNELGDALNAAYPRQCLLSRIRET